MKLAVLPLLLLATCSFAVAAVATAATVAGDAKRERNDLRNGDFEKGLDGWMCTGRVRLERADGHSEVRLGPGKAALEQRYDIPGLRIVWFGAKVRGEAPEAAGTLRARCFDAPGHLLMEFRGRAEKKDGDAGLYFKTHARTAYLVVGVEVADRSGMLRVSNAVLRDEDRGRREHPAEVDLDRYMDPIWRGTTVLDEAVLPYSERGAPAGGSLLFQPTRILSVTDATRTVRYEEGKDYAFQGGVLTVLPASRIPVVRDSDQPAGPFPWLDLAGRHLLVSYTHEEGWHGPVATYQGDGLSRTMTHLADHRPLTVVALGDSITLGINVSAYRQVPPYLPTWAELFVRRLGRLYGNDRIRLYNVGLGGMTAAWGRETAKDAVASLKPDLVLVAFGMNDFWSVSPAGFRESIRQTIDSIRTVRPEAEFLLISSMRFDPAYTDDPVYVGHLEGYADELRALTGPGIRLLDMTALTDALYRAKKAKDFLSDPMHPNDFLARWYAQSLVETLDGRQNSRFLLAPRGGKRTFFLDPNGDDTAAGSASHPWRSLERVSRQSLEPGDEIVLASGAVFHGSLELGGDDAGTAKLPIVVRSAAGAPAVIVSPDRPAISASGSGVEIRDLVLRGDAKAAKQGHHGVLLMAASNRSSEHVRVERVEVSGFGDCGISVGAAKGSRYGFADLRISGARVHDNFGSGIVVGDEISWEGKEHAHRDLRITDCEVVRNGGGSGIIVSGVDGAKIEFCRATDNRGAGGGVGIWAWAARHVTFRHCIATGTRSGGGDGGGFDLDGGCVECVVERCLTYDNDGPGYMHCDYPSAPKTHANVIRDSLSIDDGRKARGDSIGFGFVSWGSGLDDCVIENNRAICLRDDGEARENGLFFVTFLDGSRAPDDVPHMKDCVFRGNVAEAYAFGVAFVRESLLSEGINDVRFEENEFRSYGLPPFWLGERRFETLSEWRSAIGQSTAGRFTSRRGNLPTIGEYRSLKPRDLPKLFARIARKKA